MHECFLNRIETNALFLIITNYITFLVKW